MYTLNNFQTFLFKSNGNGTYQARYLAASDVSYSIFTYKPGQSSYSVTITDMVSGKGAKNTLTFTKVNQNQITFKYNNSSVTTTMNYYGTSLPPGVFTNSSYAYWLK